MGQATTISALVIRFLTTLQATVCTAMLASMFVERKYVQKADIIQFSIIRAINDGPQRLTELVISLPRAIVCIEAFLTLSLTLENLALQFTSSILFSDIHVSPLIGFSSPIQVPNYTKDNLFHLYGISVTEQSPMNRMFGEVVSNISSTPDSRGFSDSGWRQQAILPLTSPEERTAVRTFQGDAAVMRSRVSCMRPKINAVIRSVNHTTDYPSWWGGALNGSVDFSSSIQDAHPNSSLCNYQGCFKQSFECQIAAGGQNISESQNGSSYQSEFCAIGPVGRPWHGDYHIGYQDSDESWSNRSVVYLVYSNNMASDEWFALRNTTYNLSSLPSINKEEWKSFEIIPGRFLNISLCFLAYSIDSKLVTMKANGNLHEPDRRWSFFSKV